LPEKRDEEAFPTEQLEGRAVGFERPGAFGSVLGDDEDGNERDGRDRVDYGRGSTKSAYVWSLTKGAREDSLIAHIQIPGLQLPSFVGSSDKTAAETSPLTQVLIYNRVTPGSINTFLEPYYFKL
jgi:hypothetical protein